MHDHSYSSGVVLFPSLLYPLLGGTIRSLRGHSGLPKTLRGAGPWTGGGTFNSGAFIYLYNDLTFSIFIYFFFFLNIFLFLFSMHLDFLLYLFEVLIIHMLKILSDCYLLVWWAYPTWQVGKMVLKLIEFTAIYECYLFSPKYLPRGMGFSLSFHPDSK